MMARSTKTLQSKAGYIDARPHIPQLEEVLLQRTPGPYIWVTHDRRAQSRKRTFDCTREAMTDRLLYLVPVILRVEVDCYVRAASGHAAALPSDRKRRVIPIRGFGLTDHRFIRNSAV